MLKLSCLIVLSERFCIPAYLCNDANACALAEWKYGAGKGTRNMVFFTFGTGLGAGLILDGKLCDTTVRVPETETFKVQELHLPIYHYLCASIEKRIFG